MTSVGTQTEFADAVSALIEMDYEAVEAYDAAISRAQEAILKNKLEEFKKDHLDHIHTLSNLLRNKGQTPPTGPSRLGQVLKKGKVIMMNMLGEDSLVQAMQGNEAETNEGYTHMNERTDIWPEAKPILEKGLADERRHKDWLDGYLKG